MDYSYSYTVTVLAPSLENVLLYLCGNKSAYGDFEMAASSTHVKLMLKLS